MKRFCVAVLFFLTTLQAFSQEADSIRSILAQDTLHSHQNSDTIYNFAESGFLLTDSLMAADTLEIEIKKPKSPTKALMFALVLPGLGQAYNGKYWKIPIVWGALGAVGYVMVYNTRQYKQATIDYINNETSDNERYLNGWKRNMELSYIVGVMVYGLQILDAYVDANLSTWDVNDNLALGISPSLQPMMTHQGLSGLSGGLTCSIKFKGR